MVVAAGGLPAGSITVESKMDLADRMSVLEIGIERLETSVMMGEASKVVCVDLLVGVGE